MNIKLALNKLYSSKKVLLILLFVMLLVPKNVFAYTITYHSTFGKFSNNTTTNVVEYDNNHNVVSGTYEEPTYTNGTDSSDFIAWYSEYDAKNRVNINTVSSDKDVYAAYEKITWRFGYTGAEEYFSLPIKAGLRLKVWGAQGGIVNDTYYGGFGGYATGLFDFEANQNIYVNVGGQGENAKGLNAYASGGYNGGGNGSLTGASHLSNTTVAGGGGATHIATVSGLLSSLESNRTSISIVAGGGGGSAFFRTNGGHFNVSNTGHGGGYIGSTGRRGNTNQVGYYGYGGSQTSAGEKGGSPGTKDATFGSAAIDNSGENAGGGGGYYGGGAGYYTGGGGSGFIANTVEGSRHMATHKGEDGAFTSDEDSTKTIETEYASVDPIEDYAKLGNGYAIAELTRIEIEYVNNIETETNTIKDQYTGSLAQNLPITERTGYTSAWYKGNDVWDFNDPVNFDMVLEAKYTPITYNITYNLVGGTVSGNPDTYTIEDVPIALNNPTSISL